jgi:diguanylate cyclase (GGDEF)-like protein
MQTLNDEQLELLASAIAVPAFLIQGTSAWALNRESAELNLKTEELLASIPEDADQIEAHPIFLTDAGMGWRYSLAGKKILYGGEPCWLLEIMPFGLKDTLQGLHKIAAARQIMLRISSQIDRLDTDRDIYEFILDNCGEAVEHSEFCTLMLVEGDQARIVAKRGFLDDVFEITFPVKDTFLALETGGKLDRIAIINDLSKFKSKYNLEAKTQVKGAYLQSTLSTPIYVNHELYAILNFDAISRNAFTKRDAELLNLVKSNIEIILENHAMHAEILRLSKTDQLTGLYNRTYLRGYLKKVADRRFSIGVFDMNNLKGVNDGHGHLSGDLALQRLAEGLQGAFPPDCPCFRMGGDEFLCILYGMEQPEIDGCVARLREKFHTERLVLADNVPIELSFSCGFARHDPGAAMDGVLQIADDEMYREKRKLRRSRGTEPEQA